MKNSLLLAGLLAGTLVLGSCGKDETEAAAPTLYDWIGKTEDIAKIVVA